MDVGRKELIAFPENLSVAWKKVIQKAHTKHRTS